MEEYTRRPPEPEQRARYKITVEGGCLRAVLRNRGTMEDVELFLMTVAATSKMLDHGRVLISVDSSNRISPVLQKAVFFSCLNELWSSPSHKVAVLGERPDIGAADAHVESYAQQRGVNVRSFDDEAAALQWVRDRRLGRDRRRAESASYAVERRQWQRRNVAAHGNERASAACGN